MNEYSWVEKYKPKTIGELMCNRAEVRQIQLWIKQFETIKRAQYHESKKKKKAGDEKKKKIKMDSDNKNFKSCIIITGDHGIGKSISIELVLQEHGYEVQTINFSNLKGGTKIEDIIGTMVNKSNILNVMLGQNTKKPAIIIDELESITTTNEKSSLPALIKLNDLSLYCPIIYISNDQHSKLLNDIKKMAVEIRFNPPQQFELEKIMSMIAKKENIRFQNQQVVDKIVYHSQRDIRRLINTLQDIKYAYEDGKVTLERMEIYCIQSKQKDIKIDLWTATECLMYKFEDIELCLKQYETDKTLVPLTLHENYPRVVCLNNNDREKQFNIMFNVADTLSTGDVVENYIFGDQTWEMQQIHGFFTCVVSSYFLNENIKGDIKKLRKTEFASDLNKTSIKKINKKNIIKANECLKDMAIMDYIYVNKIIRHLMDNKQIDECVNMLKDYGIQLEHIEGLLKIDKIKNSKNALTTKEKREFSKLLN